MPRPHWGRLAAIGLATLSLIGPAQGAERWSAEKAAAWAQSAPWAVGSNFLPSTAINQLEMWQAASFDPATIDRELGWAEGLGFTSMRVFLHDLLWTEDPQAFLGRVDQFLAICERHKIRPMIVLFDSVWDPDPKLGPQRAPRPGLHNSGWVQSPGRAVLTDPGKQGHLEGYVKGVIGRFKDDPRVLVWDLWNEPDNLNGSSYGKDEPAGKVELTLALLAKAYGWAREVGPTQPLTSGVWQGSWDPEKASPTARLQIAESDVLSFHAYNGKEDTARRIAPLLALGRPIHCTEYMARPIGSRFDPDLGYFRVNKIGAYNWGFVDGKSQTIYPWDSWKKPYDGEPPVWFHDIFRRDGTPYIPAEVDYIRLETGKVAAMPPVPARTRPVPQPAAP